jgi:hypothetical protein
MSPLHLQEEQRMIMVFSNVVSWKFACFGDWLQIKSIGFLRSLARPSYVWFGLIVAGDS